MDEDSCSTAPRQLLDEALDIGGIGMDRCTAEIWSIKNGWTDRSSKMRRRSA
jgi:hypothetical protein